jgi:hypothetical protein
MYGEIRGVVGPKLLASTSYVRAPLRNTCNSTIAVCVRMNARMRTNSAYLDASDEKHHIQHHQPAVDELKPEAPKRDL